ncbi:hypothetical protein C8A03DRAFT_18282, partial [Achaetomium macrosporum]
QFSNSDLAMPLNAPVGRPAGYSTFEDLLEDVNKQAKQQRYAIVKRRAHWDKKGAVRNALLLARSSYNFELSESRARHGQSRACQGHSGARQARARAWESCRRVRQLLRLQRAIRGY